MGAVVYMLLCADGSYYVGSTTDDGLDRRLAEHNTGVYPDAYTASRRSVTLLGVSGSIASQMRSSSNAA